MQINEKRTDNPFAISVLDCYFKDKTKQNSLQGVKEDKDVWRML